MVDPRAQLATLEVQYAATRSKLATPERMELEHELDELAHHAELAQLHTEFAALGGEGLDDEERAELENELRRLEEIADMKPGTPFPDGASG